jgi:hypothetical protein
MRNLPGPPLRRHGVASAPAWLTPRRKKLVLAALVLLIAAFLAAVFLHRN